MNQTKTVLIITLFVVLCGLVLSFSTFAGEKSLIMATTTSTEETGLLDYLAPYFTRDTGIELKWVATGSGKALMLGQNCDVDVLLVHAPDAEKEYVAKGYGINRREIMYNDFVIIGPVADLAGIHGKSVKESLEAIKSKKGIFVSRGDNSGTHIKEISLWQQANLFVPDKESWYIQAGQGMLATIAIAAERGGYTLADRGTYIKYEDNMAGRPPLKILVQGDPDLINQYSVIIVNPARCLNAKTDLAMKFSEWMAGNSAQKRIQDFTLIGKQLFFPNAK